MKDYLPVGSVVLLKKGSKPVSIMGYKVVSSDDNFYNENNGKNKEQVFDYCGVLYPEGLIGINVLCMFNHENIKKVLHVGYTTDESKEFNNSP